MYGDSLFSTGSNAVWDRINKGVGVYPSSLPTLVLTTWNSDNGRISSTGTWTRMSRMKCDGFAGDGTEATHEAGEVEKKILKCIIQRPSSDMRELCHSSLGLLCRD